MEFVKGMVCSNVGVFATPSIRNTEGKYSKIKRTTLSRTTAPRRNSFIRKNGTKSMRNHKLECHSFAIRTPGSRKRDVDLMKYIIVTSQA